MGNYTKFCKSKGCEYFIEWEFDTEYGPYPCNSCTKIGQSYKVEEYPEDCLFLDEIKLQDTQDKNKSLEKKDANR